MVAEQALVGPKLPNPKSVRITSWWPTGAVGSGTSEGRDNDASADRPGQSNHLNADVV